MRAALLCLLLSPLVQGMIVGLSTCDSANGPFSLDIVDPRKGNFKKIADVADGISGTSALRDESTVLFSTVLASPFRSYLTALDINTRDTQQVGPFPNLWFVSIGIDKVTEQTFVLALSMTEKTDFLLYEFLADQTLREMIELPGNDYGFLNAYSSSKHIFFVFTTTTTREESSNVLAVDTAEQGKILYNVSVGFSIQSMVYDDTADVLYVWGADSTRTAMLVSVDYTTGETLETFFASDTFTAGAACINEADKIIYSTLIDRPSNRPTILSLELSSGYTNHTTASREPITLSFL